MDTNTEAAIICVGALLSLSSSLLLAAGLFGMCSFPRLQWPDWCCLAAASEDEGESEPWCLTLAIRWFCYKYCCCCGSRLKIQEWMQEDLRKLEVSRKFGPYCCQAALQHVVVPEHLKPMKCSKKGIKCEDCGEPLVCDRHEEWKEKTACECKKELSPE